MKIRNRAPSMGSSGSIASRGEQLPAPIVETANGSVQGKRIRLDDGTACDMFHGIPFAKPPVGELRFRKPEKADSWDGVLKCSRFRDRSVQQDMFWDKVMQNTNNSEDCLYLNVYAPAIEPGKKYPVFFYVHGGGFMMDSPARLVPKKLCRQMAARGVIMVTATYRLGYLGFFSTGDDACKGNFGMLDQVMALQWTKDNIQHFGGNPDDITVGGQSAGAVSADLLSLSPLSRDLFQKKIVMGGNAFCHWAVAKKDEISDYCRKKAIVLGWKPQKDYNNTLDENKDMIDFLRTVPAHKFATSMHGNSIIFSESRLPLAPCYDGEFLPRNVKILREEAPKMESIVGVGEFESLLFVAIGFLRCNGKDIDNALNVLAKKSSMLTAKEIIETVQKIYGDTAMARCSKSTTAKLFVTLSSDIISNYACWRFMQHSFTHDKATYAYSFDYTSKKMFGWLGPMLPFMGGTHASELIYLMDVNYFSSPFSKNKGDMEMCTLTADYFTNFIKTGDPNGQGTSQHAPWTPLNKETGIIDIFSLSLTPRTKNEVFGNRMLKLDEILDGLLSNHELNTPPKKSPEVRQSPGGVKSPCEPSKSPCEAESVETDSTQDPTEYSPPQVSEDTTDLSAEALQPAPFVRTDLRRSPTRSPPNSRKEKNASRATSASDCGREAAGRSKRAGVFSAGAAVRV